ncbi:TPA: hypothetical protein R7D88_005421 [Klebsiella pneumoniae]|nr:hypothetical protein [Klebsiella pneumoniae]
MATGKSEKQQVIAFIDYENWVLSRRVSEPFWFRQDAGTRNAKTPLVNPLTREVCMKYLALLIVASSLQRGQSL